MLQALWCHRLAGCLPLCDETLDGVAFGVVRVNKFLNGGFTLFDGCAYMLISVLSCLTSSASRSGQVNKYLLLELRSSVRWMGSSSSLCSCTRARIRVFKLRAFIRAVKYGRCASFATPVRLLTPSSLRSRFSLSCSFFSALLSCSTLLSTCRISSSDASESQGELCSERMRFRRVVMFLPHAMIASTAAVP